VNWEGVSLTPDDLKETWRNFRQRRKDLRSKPAQKLVLHYLALVKKIVAGIVANGPIPTFNFDDLASAGLDGLYNALKRYRSNRRTLFRTYAYPLIRGAILETLRNNDHLPRLQRKLSRRLDDATNAAAQKYDRPPTEHEIAHELHIPIRDLARFRASAHATRIRYIHTTKPNPKNNRPPTLAHLLPAPTSTNTTEIADLRNYLLRGLNRRSRLILVLYYAENLSMKEIAAVLNISEARVSQIHSQSIAFLRDHLRSPTTDDNLPPSHKKPKPKK